MRQFSRICEKYDLPAPKVSFDYRWERFPDGAAVDGQEVSAWYAPRSQEVVVGRYVDTETLAHELAHHFDFLTRGEVPKETVHDERFEEWKSILKDELTPFFP